MNTIGEILILRTACALLLVIIIFLLAKWRMAADRREGLSIALGEIIKGIDGGFIPPESVERAKLAHLENGDVEHIKI